MIKVLNPKYSHLISVLLASLLAFGTLILGTVYAQTLEQKYVHALAPLMLLQSNVGSALQQAGFQQSDLLMIYGSSEILVGDKPMVLVYGNSSQVMMESTPYGASQFFQTYPTGFDVYEIAKGGATPLNIAQDLASIGTELRGKKVVLSFTPTLFDAEQVASSAYSGDFSLLHANALIFDPHLSLETKEIAAQRMNEYPETLNRDLILKFAVQHLNCRCWYQPYLYEMTWPIGQLDTWIIRLQDHWEVLSYIWSKPTLSAQVSHVPKQIDWSEEISRAVSTEKMYSNNNPYGIENEAWNAYFSKKLNSPQKAGSADYAYLQKLNDSKEWIDFDLALRVLQELGAQPLILSRPLNGPIWSAVGLSQWARKQYYAKLQDAVSPYGFPVVDFANHDGDRYFSLDQGSHTSREGWVYVDMTLDEFFHEQIH